MILQLLMILNCFTIVGDRVVEKVSRWYPLTGGAASVATDRRHLHSSVVCIYLPPLSSLSSSSSMAARSRSPPLTGGASGSAGDRAAAGGEGTAIDPTPKSKAMPKSKPMPKPKVKAKAKGKAKAMSISEAAYSNGCERDWHAGDDNYGIDPFDSDSLFESDTEGPMCLCQ